MTELAFPPRRLLRNSHDPEFQGDGWRWSLSLLLPNVLLWRSPRRNDQWADCPVPGPFTLDMLPLTRQQRRTCFMEWWLTQQEATQQP
jgi:hypothetical protein